MLADHGNGLGRGEVVAWNPDFFAGDAIEVFLYNLLSPRKSVASAHCKIIARSVAEIEEQFPGIENSSQWSAQDELLEEA